MKKSLYIWVPVITGVVLLSGVVLSGSNVWCSGEENAAVAKTVNNSCAASCDESSVTVAAASQVSEKDCPYTGGCCGESKTVQAPVRSASCPSKSSKSATATMAGSEQTPKDASPALTSAE